MATLTETAFYTRNIIKWAIIGIIGFIILRLILGYTVGAIRRALPPPQLKPNNLYGRLSAISFPQGASPSGELTYRLETISGTIPEASSAAQVYLMPKEQINLGSLLDAQNFVKPIGFTNDPRKISDTVYRWVDPRNPLRSLELNIVSYHFTYTYAYIHDLTLFTDQQIPAPSQAISESVGFLQSLGVNHNDIDTVNPHVEYLQLKGNKFEKATSQSTANAVQVDFFRKNLNGMKVVTDNNESGVISFILSGARRADQRILSVKYRYWPLETAQVGRQAIYPLKTSAQMWQELQNHQAYYVSLSSGNTAVITDAYLAYYDSDEPQLYLQPVMVFEGENGFMAYVPAVSSQWTQ